MFWAMGATRTHDARTAEPHPLASAGARPATTAPGGASSSPAHEPRPDPEPSTGRRAGHTPGHSSDRETGTARPRLRLAVVTCMDCRIDVYEMLGLRRGDAHILRNAGGVVTDDVIRSLTISHRRLGTRRVFVIHHTDCGMLELDEHAFRQEIGADCGIRPNWAVEAFHSLDAETKQSLRRLRASPFLRGLDEVRAFVYDVGTGVLREVLDEVWEQAGGRATA